MVVLSDRTDGLASRWAIGRELRELCCPAYSWGAPRRTPARPTASVLASNGIERAPLSRSGAPPPRGSHPPAQPHQGSGVCPHVEPPPMALACRRHDGT